MASNEGSSSFQKLATETGTVKRTGAFVDGKKSQGTTQFEFPCTPLDTMDASAIFGYGIQNPHSVAVIHAEGSFSFHKSDIIILENVEYKIRNIRKFVNYRKPGIHSFEIVLEIPET